MLSLSDILSRAHTKQDSACFLINATPLPILQKCYNNVGELKEDIVRSGTKSVFNKLNKAEQKANEKIINSAINFSWASGLSGILGAILFAKNTKKSLATGAFLILLCGGFAATAYKKFKDTTHLISNDKYTV